MERRSVTGVLCDRARQWSSLGVDGELSDLEGALLARHLDGCPACADFDANLRSTTATLRSAPLERPPASFELPAPRPVGLPVRRRTALAAVAAAAALGSLVGALLERPATTPTPEAPQLSLLTRDVSQLRQLPRGGDPTPSPAREPGLPPEGIV